MTALFCTLYLVLAKWANRRVGWHLPHTRVPNVFITNCVFYGGLIEVALGAHWWTMGYGLGALLCMAGAIQLHAMWDNR